jgi:hypothetical protein
VALRGKIELSDGVHRESRNRVLESLKAFLGTSLVGVGDLVCYGLLFGVELISYNSEDNFKPLKKVIRTSSICLLI